MADTKNIEAGFSGNGTLYTPTYFRFFNMALRGVSLPATTSQKKADPALDREPNVERRWMHSIRSLLLVGYHSKRQKTETNEGCLTGPGTGPGLNDVGKDNSYVMAAFELEEVSSKLECSCCFDDECSFVTMIQCADGHLFCRDCVRGQAGAAVGSLLKDILCMDLSGCKQPFPATELQKCLEPHTIDLWQRISQAQDIAAAQLEGLEHCPKCEFCMIFEVGIDVAPDLICLKSDCGFISCRSCKQKNHPGQDCKDGKLRKEHVVEEAMTSALVRACPGCKTPFVKDDGCNKIMCQSPQCRMVSCYLCRVPITLENGYDHFDRSSTPGGILCALWDPNHGDSSARHNAEVAAAGQAARMRTQSVRGSPKRLEGFWPARRRRSAIL